MPGIIGVVGGGAAGLQLLYALRSLQHFATYGARQVTVGDDTVLGQVWRDGDRSDTDWWIDSESGIATLVNGSVFDAGSGARRLHARQIAERYLRNGALEPLALDGAFVIAIADPRSRSVLVCNDRLGTLPLYYAQTKLGVAFAPEAKALFATGLIEPRLSMIGVVTFLNRGYCLGKTTLFEGVSCLEPGSLLTIEADTGRGDVRRYWKMVYSPAAELRKRSAAETALYEATRAAHEQITADSGSGFELMLSGGWDSRGILGFLSEIGKLPRRVVAWGRTRDVPLSDPHLAAQLAERFELPFSFVAYDSDQFCENAESWCRMSELANDNIGWFAEGAPLLASSYRTDADFTLAGDEAWGWHGCPRTEREVKIASMPATLGKEVRACLAPDLADELAAHYEREVDLVLEPCENDDPLDRRDFLYLHGRVARFIFALGYYKELAVEVRRPFLLAGVLDTLAQIPGRFRIDKNLYISMLTRYFPELAALPPRRARSLPEWSHDIRAKPALRRAFLELLDERRFDGVLGSVLDVSAVARARDEFFAEPPRPAPPTPPQARLTRAVPLRLRQRLRATGLYPGNRRMTPGYPARGRVDVLRCIALLSLLQRSLPTFRAAAPAFDAITQATSTAPRHVTGTPDVTRRHVALPPVSWHR